MQIGHILKVYSRQLSHFNTVLMEKMISYELGTGTTGMIKIIPNVRKLIAPIINTAFDFREEKVDVNLKKVSLSEDRLRQTFISVNAWTS